MTVIGVAHGSIVRSRICRSFDVPERDIQCAEKIRSPCDIGSRIPAAVARQPPPSPMRLPPAGYMRSPRSPSIRDETQLVPPITRVRCNGAAIDLLARREKAAKHGGTTSVSSHFGNRAELQKTKDAPFPAICNLAAGTCIAHNEFRDQGELQGAIHCGGF
jgi:hypothetical protein